MPSRFWTWVANLTPGETARSGEVNSQFAAVDAGLASIEQELNRSIRFTADSAPDETYAQIANTPAQRANRVIGFDSNGKPTITSATWLYRGPWASSTAYVQNDVVLVADDGLYIGVSSHTSASVFATDVAAGRWVKVIDLAEVSRAVRKFQIVTAAMSPFTAAAGSDLMVDVSGGAVTIRLPAAPTLQDQPVSIVHLDGPIATNAITVDRNGGRIMGLAENMFVTDSNAAFELAFSDTLRGWRLVRGS